MRTTTAAIDATTLGRALAIAAVCLSGCSGRPQPSRQTTSGHPGAPVTAKTTDGALATENFLAELAQARRQHAQQPADQRRTRALVDHLLTDAQFFGHLAAYDQADAVTRTGLAAAPDNAEAHLLRARALAALHEFPDAAREADRAEALGADAEAVDHLRVGVWQALGDVEKALPHLRAWRRARPNLDSLGAEAGALADARDFERAEAAFTEAKRAYADVSPFALGWLEFQEGHMWETAGRSDLARSLFESALARLPRYAQAAGHLARLVAAPGRPADLDRARRLLEPLIASSDDPEYVGQLGGVYRQLGRRAEADALIERARRDYERLTAQHPAAFSDHAARFFLHVGGDPQRALSCARQNLAVRHTPDARELVEEAERATVAAELTAR